VLGNLVFATCAHKEFDDISAVLLERWKLASVKIT